MSILNNLTCQWMMHRSPTDKLGNCWVMLQPKWTKNTPSDRVYNWKIRPNCIGPEGKRWVTLILRCSTSQQGRVDMLATKKTD